MRRAIRSLVVAAGLVFLPLAGHVAIQVGTRMRPPAVTLPAPGTTHAWVRFRAGLREVYLEGGPESIGAAQARLLRDRMVANEERLWQDYERYVPWWIARVGIQDVSRLRYRRLDEGIPPDRRRELAAQSLAFAPDPFEVHMPTYNRMVFLHALYDIALSFERSPLIGCTSFGLGPEMTAHGDTIVARAFDMETDEVLDRDKAVFLVREEGAIPFASVAWPGFVGVVTGMNEAGLFVVVHGGRAREPRAEGLPVAFSLRETLERAHDVGEAVAVLRDQDVMVSHIVFVADAAGRFAVVERAPGVPAFVRTPENTAVVTNDFKGPLSDDPRNVRVRETTTSRPRERRVGELLAKIAPHSADVRTALAMLRDHGCADGVACALGDRRAIDALIATHGVVADLTRRELWVGVGPHLSGRFVKVDVEALLAPGSDASADPPLETMPEDPILEDGRYAHAKRSDGEAQVR